MNLTQNEHYCHRRSFHGLSKVIGDTLHHTRPLSIFLEIAKVKTNPPINCWFHRSSFKGFSIVFLLPDWLKLNHLKSRTECGFSDIFMRHFCSTVAETIGVTNYVASFGAKNVQKTTFEAAEMMLGPWNQQKRLSTKLHP